MKKKLYAFLITFLALTLFAASAFAAEARWRNVASISPSIYASDNSYSSVITGLSGARSSSTYYGQMHDFSGTNCIKSGTTYKLVTTANVTRNGSAETVSNTFEKKC